MVIRLSLRYCPRHVSHIIERILVKLDLNVHFAKTMFDSEGFSLNLAQLFSSLRKCAQGMSHSFWLRVKVTNFLKAFCHL